MGCRDLEIKINFWEDQTKGLFLTRMIVHSDIPVITVSAVTLTTLLNVIDWCLV